MPSIVSKHVAAWTLAITASATAAPIVDLGSRPTLPPRITPDGTVAAAMLHDGKPVLRRWSSPLAHAQTLPTPDWLEPTRLALGSGGTLAIAAWDTREPWREAPYLYTAAGPVALDDGGTFPDGVSVPAIAVGDSGAVIGYGRLDSADLPVSFEQAGLISMPVPIAGARIESGMSGPGGSVVLGVAAEGGVMPPRTMSYSNQQWHDLGDPSPTGTDGWMLARASGPGGTLVGSGAASLFASAEPIIVHTDGSIQTLGLLDGWIAAEAQAINASGWLVGSATLFDETIFDLRTQAFAWHKSIGLIELEGEGDWMLLSATGISDDGWVVGIGVLDGVEHAYALQIPTPATVAIIFAAAFGRARRRV